ncbi:EKC/KEOPS complex subunit Cgi121p [[Candida] railenensis]|uniref:EKC/KEOPS complex subunit CGI121 n=1 Tax=[Candida] railenensis TaxID=45579 RepID=A0A9P0QSF1_9ASCO|nr:EKC/KEOPS complex subunit Cgi121p [[Candida] railenensis]
MYQVFTFPQFPEERIFLSYFTNVASDNLEHIKSQLISANKEYDYCFLNTNHLVSLEHLRSGIYRAISNYSNSSMKAKTLNTEIIFNLSPVNNIMDSIKRFGVDSNCSNVIVIKVLKAGEPEDESFKNISELFTGEVESKELTDNVLFSLVDMPRFKKVYKLNDAAIQGDGTQGVWTRLAVSACQLRGL